MNLATGRAHAPKWGPDSSTSEVSTIQMEFRDLSRVTGDDKYEVCKNFIIVIMKLFVIWPTDTVLNQI